MLKMGIYVDHENIRLSGGESLDYKVLLDSLSQGHYLIRAVSYVVVDSEQPEDLQDRLHRYRDKLRHIGFKVVEKQKRWFVDPETDIKTSKANMDMELAIDVLREIENLDVVVVCSGDGDFVRLVEAAQSRGRQVWIAAFENISKELKESADRFILCSTIPRIRRERPSGNGYQKGDYS